MRPTRLELVGFASFRDRTEVDFDDVDLFVFTGATGAGKSSLIDALVFCLYGSVPRYDDRRAVAPVISQGKLEAKVRLDFRLDGGDYSAVRVVRRQASGGATTKEARLQRGEEVLASGAKELTDAVTQLLGLPFDHFVRCVVLPQGDFAEFLHATPGDRQELLVQLLDLEVYRDIGRRANRRAADAGSRVDLLTARLDEDYEGVTPEALDDAREHVGRLEALREHLDERSGKLDALRQTAREQRRSAEKAVTRAEALEQVDVPGEAVELAGKLRAAREAATAAEAGLNEANQRLDTAADAREKLGDEEPLREAKAAHRQLAELDGRIETGTGLREEAAATLAAAQEKLDAARAAADRATAARHELLRRHRAYDLARDLHAGDDCPVCNRELDDDPAVPAPPDLEAAERDVETTTSRLEDATAARDEARRKLEKIDARLDELATQRADVLDRLDGAPGPDETGRRLAAVKQADAELEAARKALTAARGAHQQARRQVDALSERGRGAWAGFDRVRDGLAGLDLEPPAPDRDDLAASWEALAEWAAARAVACRDAAKQAVENAEEAETAAADLVADLRRRCVEAGVDATDSEPREAVAGGLAVARDEARRLEQAVEEAGQLRRERDAVEERRRVAAALGSHLRSNRFENWLLNRALHRLVGGATGILRDLSSGAYSLALNDRNEFEVVDHLNADELRSAKTLSGGETFLASLSLALALADDLADLAASGTAKLDALFLDEGFGTLDPATLDVVTQAITELGSRGRMVGLVTHVRDLADQIPVRYEVRKTANTSTVDKVMT